MEILWMLVVNHYMLSVTPKKVNKGLNSNCERFPFDVTWEI